MVVSAQFRLSGFYTETVRRISLRGEDPHRLLLWVVVTAGVLSSVLANDVVCLAMAPILIEVCARRQITPIPFLLALACASNVGSAATLIGNPQNMFIGESLRLSFAGYLLDGGLPAALGLALTWFVIGASGAAAGPLRANPVSNGASHAHSTAGRRQKAPRCW